MDNKKLDIEKQLRFRLFIILFFYVIIGFIAIMFLQYLFVLFHNPVTEYLQLRIDIIFILYLLIGFICIFFFLLEKTMDIFKRGHYSYSDCL